MFYRLGYSKEYPNQYSRTDPDLILAVETLKEKANGRISKLKIVNVPNNIKWEITEYDEIEQVEEKHNSWK